MNYNENVIKSDEKAIFAFRSLYQKYGYIQYKMSKFEEYDLYVKNKDFLISDNVITFNDIGGRLMALKPDVTLSIIKNSRDTSGGAAQKVYYSENVYRVSKGEKQFKEIMQTGLECIGSIDTYNLCEVIMLAIRSLMAISDDFVLDISHMGFLSGIFDGFFVSDAQKDSIIKCIGEKNMHEIGEICSEIEDGEKLSALISTVISTYGDCAEVIGNLRSICKSDSMNAALNQLEVIFEVLKTEGLDKNVRIDFSVANDMNYYNGIVFRGYVSSIPTGILSGGQYDRLMEKMGRKSGAVGFAVYLDMLERLESFEKQFDVDTVLLYSDGDDICEMAKVIKMLTDSGNSVLAEKKAPQNIKYRRLLRFKDRGFEIVENNG